MLSWLVENWDTIRQYAPLAGAFASGAAALGTWLGMRRRLAAWLGARREARAFARRVARNQARERVEWYARAYRALVVEQKWAAHDFHGLDVAQCSAQLREPLPAWADDEWASEYVGTLNGWKV